MIAAIVAFLAACNPAAALVALAHDRRTDRPIPVLAGAAAALAALVVAGAASQPILDVLDVNLGTFRVGAGAVLVVSGLRWLFAGAPRDAIEPDTDLRLAGFVAFPTLLTPAAAVLAVSVGAELVRSRSSPPPASRSSPVRRASTSDVPSPSRSPAPACVSSGRSRSSSAPASSSTA